MSDKPVKCKVCNGRGYFHCECWPCDCICGADDEPCDECDGTGWIEPHDWYDGAEPYLDEPEPRND